MKPLPIFLLTLLPSFFSLSQQSSRVALSLYAGPAEDGRELFSENTWKTLGPDPMTVTDTSFAFKRTSTRSASWCALSVQLGFPGTDWGVLRPLVVFSAGAGPGGLESVSFGREGVVACDTLVSAQGEMFVVDSAYSESVFRTYTSKAGAVGARFLLETPDNGLGLSLQFGLGVNYVFPLQSRFETIQSQRPAVYMQGVTPLLPGTLSTTKYTAAAPGISRLIVFVPVRLQFRCFTQLQMGAELSPGWASTQVSGYGRRNSFFFMAGLGVTWTFPDDRPKPVPAYEARV